MPKPAQGHAGEAARRGCLSRALRWAAALFPYDHAGQSLLVQPSPVMRAPTAPQNPLGPRPCQLGCCSFSPCAGDQRRQNMIDALSKDDWSAVIEQQTEQTLGNGAAAANGAPQASPGCPVGASLEHSPVSLANHCRLGLRCTPKVAKAKAMNQSANAGGVLDVPLHWCFSQRHCLCAGPA